MSNWLDLEDGQADLFASGLAEFKHGFAQSGLFSDDALAALIEKYPREYYMINMMSPIGKKQVWRHGEIAGLSGAEVLQAIRRGRFWLALRRFDIVAPDYHELVEQAFEEIHKANRQLKTFRHDSSLLISSPDARVYYHADVPYVVLWHIRGRKKFWLYDGNNKELLPDEALEGIIMRETEEEIAYKKIWDDDAMEITLEPGQAITWPQNAPHRVDNLDGLNVSITSEYYTARAQRKYGVYYANGWMRRYLGRTPASTAIDGPLALAKCALALAIKKSGRFKAHEQNILSSFRLDTNRMGAIIDIPPENQTRIEQA